MTVLKTDQTDDEGNAIWTVLIAEAPQRREQPRVPVDETAMRNSQAPLDGPVPF